MKVKTRPSLSVNLYPSTKLIVTVITHFCYATRFRRNSLYIRLAPNLENKKLVDLASHSAKFDLLDDKGFQSKMVDVLNERT